MNAEFILVGIIFILIIFVSSYGTSNKVVPYTPTSSVLPQYKYSSEGFEEEEEEGFEGYQEEEIEEGFQGDQYSMNPIYLNPSMESNLNLDEPRSDILSGSINYKSDPILDGISHLPGRPDCIGKSANLSNSMGGICLDKNTIALIKTRGNNFS